MYCITYNLYTTTPGAQRRRERQQKIEFYTDKEVFEGRYTYLQRIFAKDTVTHMLEKHTIAPHQCFIHNNNMACLLYIYEMDDDYEKQYICGVFDDINTAKTFKDDHPFNTTEAPFKEYLICIYEVVSSAP